VTGHTGGGIHDITAATLAAPLVILVASQLSRSILSWAPPPPPLAHGLGTHVGQYTALVGPSLVVFFQAIDASVLLAVLLIATLLLLTPQVLPTRCARPRQLTERTDGCIGGYEGPWVCQHTLLGMHSAAPPYPSLNGGGFTSPPRLARPSRGEVWLLADLSSRPAWYPTRGMPPAAVKLLQAARVQLTRWSTLRCCLLPPSHWSPELLDVSAGCPLS
jgi:hypothetical protein